MDMQELTDLFEGMLRPIMERLEKLEALAAEARDDDRKLEGETEAAEPVEDVVEEIVEEVVEAVKEDEDELGEYKTQMSELSEKLAEMEKASVLAEAKIAELTAEIELRDAQDAVAADISSKPHLSVMSEKLVGLYQKDKDLYAEVLEVAGNVKSDTKSILSQRVTSGFSEVQKPQDPFAAAHDVASEKGITYRQALEDILSQ